MAKKSFGKAVETFTHSEAIRKNILTTEWLNTFSDYRVHYVRVQQKL